MIYNLWEIMFQFRFISLFLISFQLQGGELMSFHLMSKGFKEHQAIPPRYGCNGENISPPLEWEEAPAETKSYVLIVDDPDAPSKVWTHWVVYNIPANVHESQEGQAPKGAIEGINDFGSLGYGGPCPPSGTHRYYFKLYALNQPLELGPGATKQEVEKAMQTHILKETQLMGTYSSTR